MKFDNCSCFLCLDRGGVKGIVKAHTLMSMQYCVNKYFIDDAKDLEEDLLEFLKCSINKPFVEEKELHLKMHTMFGTSVGALVVTALTRMNLSPDMMIINEFYEISQFHGNFTPIFINIFQYVFQALPISILLTMIYH